MPIVCVIRGVPVSLATDQENSIWLRIWFISWQVNQTPCANCEIVRLPGQADQGPTPEDCLDVAILPLIGDYRGAVCNRPSVVEWILVPRCDLCTSCSLCSTPCVQLTGSLEWSLSRVCLWPCRQLLVWSFSRWNNSPADRCPLCLSPISGQANILNVRPSIHPFRRLILGLCITSDNSTPRPVTAHSAINSGTFIVDNLIVLSFDCPVDWTVNWIVLQGCHRIQSTLSQDARWNWKPAGSSTSENDEEQATYACQCAVGVSFYNIYIERHTRYMYIKGSKFDQQLFKAAVQSTSERTDLKQH